MDAFDLLTGKVVGMAGVGLTQIAIWLCLGLLLAFAGAAPLFVLAPGALSIVTPAKLGFFVLFYLLGYVIYACVFAAGGACVNSEKEAQNVMMPVTFFLMVPWFFMQVILLGPDSRLATTLSLVPVWTPLTMFMRIVVGEPPAWQIGLAIVLTLAAIVGLFWIAARIFRVGILWYGQRPSLPEFLRWVRRP
jgi:ABC-2 type transport system permease protein